ncbi:hypothetical protein AVEN_57064-1 [Araneus ventricosus]|uniref:Uncharacterized protein n=1 Tax=Araneus ventricosus TaxID=182803 RepID=A0A4Y2G1I9_ARAVE|nr:hypothetical protein AVEN_57064-1 [Araneus ventricosus]
MLQLFWILPFGEELLHAPQMHQVQRSTSNQRMQHRKKIEDLNCINCAEKGHLAAWKGCKAFPVIKKSSTRQPGKSYSQAAADKKRKEGKTEEKETEAKTNEDTYLADLKDSLQALKEVKILLKEFLTLLEASLRCRQAKTKQEKALIVLSALMDD